MNSQLLAIGLCGALGAIARFELTAWAQLLTGARFPVGTLVINGAGSFLFGLLFGLSGSLPPSWRAPLGSGLLGAFTTFSAFSVDTVQLIESGELRLAAVNAAGSVGLGLLAAWLGLAAARVLGPQ